MIFPKVLRLFVEADLDNKEAINDPFESKKEDYIYRYLNERYELILSTNTIPCYLRVRRVTQDAYDAGAPLELRDQIAPKCAWGIYAVLAFCGVYNKNIGMVTFDPDLQSIFTEYHERFYKYYKDNDKILQAYISQNNDSGVQSRALECFSMMSRMENECIVKTKSLGDNCIDHMLFNWHLTESVNIYIKWLRLKWTEIQEKQGNVPVNPVFPQNVRGGRKRIEPSISEENKKKMESYFKLKFRGGAGEPINFFDRLCDDIPTTSTIRGFACICKLLYNSNNMLQDRKPTSFSKWYRQMCSWWRVECNNAYRPSTLNDTIVIEKFKEYL